MSINKIRFTENAPSVNVPPAVIDDSHLNRPEIFYQDTILLDLTEKITK